MYIYIYIHIYIYTFQPAEVTQVDQGKDGQTNPNEDRTNL